MSSSMLRTCLTVAVALAALAPVSLAQGGPEVSPFAGTYDAGNWSFPITISNGGHFKGSVAGDDRAKTSMDGQINADGSYSGMLSVTSSRYDERRDRTLWHTSRYPLSGTMVLDADGNIIDTPDTGGSFVWLRQ